MKKQQSLLWLSVLLLSAASHAQLRVVRNSEIQDFAKNFSCSNSVLAWQFQNLVSVFDENAKAAQKRSSGDQRPLVLHDGTAEQWMYRGVTNRQFNEAQILRVIFNDSTSVSESRWLTESLFGDSAGQVVTARDNFQSLPKSEREDKFKRSYISIAQKVQALVDQPGGYLNGFTEHARVGSSFNGTPVAIQFLTPHKRFAEMYGEFVLHVREVVRRGIDVERYNYHIPSLGYRIGSIYAHDVDEYMVPSHIPSWDIQVIKVRDGSGWHLGNYGPPLYYYTKLYKEKNPCETYAVRVDVLRTGKSDDSQREPVGILLRCTKDSCDSKFDGDFPHAERMKRILSQVKVDGKPLYFLSYKTYQAMNPEVIKSANLATLVDLFPVMQDDMKANAKMWEQIFLAGFDSDYQSAAELTRLIPSLRTAPIQAATRQALQRKLSAKDFVLTNQQVVGWLKLSADLDFFKQTDFRNVVLRLIVNSSTRALIVTTLNQMSSANPQAAELIRLVYQKMTTLKDLTPIEEVILAVKQRAGGRLQPAVFEAGAKGLSSDPGFAVKVFKDLVNDKVARQELFAGSTDLVSQNPDKFPGVDGATLWAKIAPELNGTATRDEIANYIGLFLDLDFALKKRNPLEMSALIADTGLPAGREVDTIRSLWSYARLWTAPEFNAYQFFSSGIRSITFERLAKEIETSNADAATKDRDLKNLREQFVQFFAESVSPPEPILGFSALYAISVINKQPDVMLISKADEVNIGSADRPVKVASQFPNGILKGCFSAFYLQVLKKQIDTEKDAGKKRTLVDNLGVVIQGYKDYAYNALTTDIATHDHAKLLQERFKWNAQDNSVGLAMFLEGLTTDSNKKDKLRDAVQALRQKFPQMPAQIPPQLTGENAEFWAQFKSRN